MRYIVIIVAGMGALQGYGNAEDMNNELMAMLQEGFAKRAHDFFHSDAPTSQCEYDDWYSSEIVSTYGMNVDEANISEKFLEVGAGRGSAMSLIPALAGESLPYFKYPARWCDMRTRQFLNQQRSIEEVLRNSCRDILDQACFAPDSNSVSDALLAALRIIRYLELVHTATACMSRNALLGLYVETMQCTLDNGKLSSTHTDRLKVELESMKSAYRPEYSFLSDHLVFDSPRAWDLPYLQGMGLIDARSTACIDITLVTLSVLEFREQVGRFPGDLDELVPEFLSEVPIDPMANNRYTLRRELSGIAICAQGECADGQETASRSGIRLRLTIRAADIGSARN